MIYLVIYVTEMINKNSINSRDYTRDIWELTYRHDWLVYIIETCELSFTSLLTYKQGSIRIDLY